MSRKNYGKFAKMVTLGLLLGAGCGYSTGISAAEHYLESVTLSKRVSGDSIYVTEGKYDGTSITEPKPLGSYMGADFAGFKVDSGTAATTLGTAITLGTADLFNLSDSKVEGNIKLVKDASLILTNMPVKGKIEGDRIGAKESNLTINGTGTVEGKTYSVDVMSTESNVFAAISRIKGLLTLNDAIVNFATTSDLYDPRYGAHGIFQTNGVNMTDSSINVNVDGVVSTDIEVVGISNTSGNVRLVNSSINVSGNAGVSNDSEVIGIGGVSDGNLELTDSVINSIDRGIWNVSRDVVLRGTKDYTLAGGVVDKATIVAGNIGISKVEGNVTLGGLMNDYSSESTVLKLLTTDSLNAERDAFYRGEIDSYTEAVKEELTKNSVIVRTDIGAAVTDVKGNVEIYGVREGDAAAYTYSTKLKGKEGIISSGGDVGVYGAEINAHGSGIEGAGNVTLMKSQLVNWEGYSIRYTKGNVIVVDSNVESHDMYGGAGISVVQGDVSITGSEIVSNYQKGIEYVGYTSETALLAKAVNLTVTDSDVGGYNGAVAYVTGSVILDGAVLSSNKYGSWTIENVGSKKVDGKYGSVFVGGGTEVVDENTGSKGDAPHNGGLIQKVYGSVVVDGTTGASDNKLVSNFGSGIKEVGISQNDDGSWGGVKVLNGAHVETYQDSITNVKGGVVIDGVGTLVQSEWGGVWTINTIGSEKDGAGNYGGVTVSGGAKVQDKCEYGTVFDGGAISNIYGGVVVTGSGTEVSSVQGIGIKDVGIKQNDDGSWGGVTVSDGASVMSYDSAIVDVKGDVLVDGGTEGAAITDYANSKTKVISENGTGIADVTGRLDVVRGVAISAKGDAIYNIGKDVVIDHSQISSTDAYAVNKVGGSVAVSNGSELKGGIYDVKGGVLVADSNIDSTAILNEEKNFAIAKVTGIQETTAADGDMGVIVASAAAGRRAILKANKDVIFDIDHGVRAQHADLTSVNGTAILNVGDEDGNPDATGNVRGNLWLDDVVAVGYGAGIDTILGNATLKSSIVVSTNGIGIANTSGSVIIDGYSSTNVNDTPVTASVFAYGDAINMVGKNVSANGAILVSSNGDGIVKVNGDVNLSAVDLSAENSAITDVGGRVTVTGSNITGSTGNGIEKVEGNVVVVGSTITAGKDGINRTAMPSGEANDWIQNTTINANDNGINLENRDSQHSVVLNNVNITAKAVGIRADKGSYVYLTDRVLDGTAAATGEKGHLSIVLKENGSKNNTVVGIDVKEGSNVNLTDHSGDISIKLNRTGAVYDTVANVAAIQADGVNSVVFVKNLESVDVAATDGAYGFKATNGARIGGLKDGQFTHGTWKAGAGRNFTVEASGDGGFAQALRAEGTGSQIMLDMQGGSIGAKAENGPVTAIAAVNGGSVELDKVKDVVASGKNAVIAVSASGSNSYAEVDFDGSILKATSTDDTAYGVSVDDGGTVVIEDADGKVLDMEVKGQNAVMVYSYGTGDNNVSITNANVIVEATAEGGNQKLLRATNGTTNLILDNVTVMGAPKAEGGAIIAGSESLSDVTATDVEVLTGAVANVKLNNHSSFNGKVEAGGTGVINMAFDNTSTWGVTDTCKVNKLLNYGLVDMTVDNKYGTGLTVDELTGNGKIAMDVDFEAVDDVTRTDTVKVGSVDDDIRINVLPRFKNLLTGEAVLIFTGEGVEKLNSSNVTFNGENINGANKIDYGAFSYSAAFEEGWLTMLPDWKGTDVVLSAKGNAALSAVIDPETWYQDTEALFDNMDEFAADRAKQQIWAKYTNKKNTYDESFKGAVNCDVDKKYNGVVVGWDNRAKHFEKANADLYVGAMLTYGSGRYNWNDGSNDLDGKGVGLYTVYKTAKGAYVGATMKYNKYKFDEIKGNQHDGFNTTFKGDYGSNAYGIDLAAGRRYAKDLEDGFYVEPQIGLGYVRYNNGSYDLNAMDVDVNGMTSLRGRFGVQFGTHKQTGKGGFYDIFARVTLNREFKGKDDVKLDWAYNFEVDQSGTWVNFAIGTRVGNMNKFNVDLSANLSRGKHESKVGVKAGLNFMF